MLIKQKKRSKGIFQGLGVQKNFSVIESHKVDAV